MMQGYGAVQGTGSASPYGASQSTGGAASSNSGSSSANPIQAIGSALAQAAFGNGLNQPAAASNTATLQSTNSLGRKMA